MECDDAAVERQKLVSNDEEDDQNTITNLSSSGQAKSVQTPISPVLSNKLFSSGETSRSQNSTNYSLGKGMPNEAPLTTRLNYVNERKPQDAKPKAKKVQREHAVTSDTTPPSTSSNLPEEPPPTAVPSSSASHIHHHQHHHPPHSQPEPQYQRPKPPDSLPSASSGGGAGGGRPRNNPSANPVSASSMSSSSIAGLNTKAHTFSTRPLKHHSFISEVPDVRHMERALLGLLEDFHSGKLKAFGSGCTMEQMTSIREQQESLAKLHFDLGTEAFTGGGTTGGNTKSDNELQAQSNMKKLVQKLEQLSFSIEKLHHSSNVDK
ncbi:coiled-coil domain-containing protein 28B isoform X1 [Anopheles bellator]|uniref:coiled-coil domain-containing protein 28B isoform X1 n=1 Tax=Anopheles bellator TaxID=139047 RepID=UPI002647A169|nr:coiled-coil domain-containing protein 28B isoform X1 [Anopheles bellator]